MCNQAVGLLAGELEKGGIAAVAIQLLREVAEKVRPPRGLLVPYAHGSPLGQPRNAALQTRVITAALALLGREAAAPILEEL
jgi:hypothetical protein